MALYFGQRDLLLPSVVEHGRAGERLNHGHLHREIVARAKPKDNPPAPSKKSMTVSLDCINPVGIGRSKRSQHDGATRGFTTGS